MIVSLARSSLLFAAVAVAVAVVLRSWWMLFNRSISAIGVVATFLDLLDLLLLLLATSAAVLMISW